VAAARAIGAAGDGEKSRNCRDRVYQNENRCERYQRELEKRRHAFILLTYKHALTAMLLGVVCSNTDHFRQNRFVFAFGLNCVVKSDSHKRFIYDKINSVGNSVCFDSAAQLSSRLFCTPW
jgi:hypothetical protein